MKPPRPRAGGFSVLVIIVGFPCHTTPTLWVAEPKAAAPAAAQSSRSLMRHYEIILLIHPDQSEQVPAMLERYKGLVTAGGGKVHRVEDWGRRQLAYMIQKLAKAHYLCLNIECSKEVLTELETGFRFNDAVLRHLTVKAEKAETSPSVMMKSVEKEEARKAAQESTA
jgi:small subunit ribosomal protein S6